MRFFAPAPFPEAAEPAASCRKGCFGRVDLRSLGSVQPLQNDLACCVPFCNAPPFDNSVSLTGELVGNPPHEPRHHVADGVLRVRNMEAEVAALHGQMRLTASDISAVERKLAPSGLP